MSGSDESDEELVAGRVNRASDQTTMWAENQYSTTSILFIETGNFRRDFGGVRDPSGSGPARWAQVLLGQTLTDRASLSPHLGLE
jgi:hypothetical protein